MDWNKVDMKIKNEEWIRLKKKFLSMVEVFGNEIENFSIPMDADDYTLTVSGVAVHPSFLKKPEELRVSYDLSLCDTRIRTISFGVFKDAARVEVTFKDDVKINHNF